MMAFSCRWCFKVEPLSVPVNDRGVALVNPQDVQVVVVGAEDRREASLLGGGLTARIAGGDESKDADAARLPHLGAQARLLEVHVERRIDARVKHSKRRNDGSHETT